MDSLIAKLRDALRSREEFEAGCEKCQNWLSEAETALASDLKGSSNLKVLEEQCAKYSKLQDEATALGPELSVIMEKRKALLPSLKEPDRHVVSDRVSSLTSKMSLLSSSIRDKLGALQTAIQEFATFSNIIEEAIRYTKDVRDQVNNLNKPVGSALEDSQGLLASYEVGVVQS